MLKSILFVVFTCLFFNTAQADEKPIVNPRKPVLEITDSGEYELDLSYQREGEPVTVRRARLVIYNSPKINVTIPIRITETECGTQMVEECSAQFDIGYYEVKAIWTVHPESSKIGKTPYYQIGELRNPLQFFPYFPHRLLPKNDGTDVGFSPLNMKCPQWNWIPVEMKKTHSIHVLRWEYEDNIDNEQTERNENVSAGSISDIHFKLENNVAVASQQGHSSMSILLEIPFVYGTSFAFFRDSNQQVCQATVQSGGRSELLKVLNDHQRNIRPIPGSPQERKLLLGESSVNAQLIKQITNGGFNTEVFQ